MSRRRALVVVALRLWHAHGLDERKGAAAPGTRETVHPIALPQRHFRLVKNARSGQIWVGTREHWGMSSNWNAGENAVAELNQEMLFATCRAIYEMAGENYVLPPLIRDAGSLETQPSYMYSCPVGKDELHFLVALDEAYADRNALAYSRLPLKFQVELRDTKLHNPAVEISGSEKYELIRAFLLGAKIPILAEKINEEPKYKLSIQISSRFFVDCRELSTEHGGCFSKVICDNVGRKIYERSREFFADQQQGLAVWSLRAAQGLFGEAKPVPEAFWPNLLKDTVAIVSPVAATANERVWSWHPRYAVAATILVGLLGIGALAANFALRCEALAPLEMAASPIEIRLADLRPERTAVAPAETNNTFASLRRRPPRQCRLAL